MKVIESRKNQLHRQKESVMHLNEEAEKVSLVSLTKAQIKLKYPSVSEKNSGQ